MADILFCSRDSSAPASSIWSVGSLSEDFTELRIVLVLVCVMYPHMPLEVVGPRIFMLPIWAKRTYVTRRFMDQTMPDHLILALETFAAFGPRAALDWTVMRPRRRVDIRVRVE